MTQRAALVTNVLGYAGPPAVSALLQDGYRVFAHDTAFTDAAPAAAFIDGRAGITPISDAAPTKIIETVLQQTDSLAALVSNDHWPRPMIWKPRRWRR